MGDYSNLPVSDGTGDAALMHVDTDRVIGSHTLSVDSVSNVPAGHFIVTVGTLLASGFVDPSTKIDFFGHLDGSDLAIDAFCPGSTDAGNTIGQVAFIKPNTDWANLVAQFIMNASGHGTPEDITADDLTAATIHLSGLLTAAAGITMSGGAFTTPAGAVLKASLEKSHYNALTFIVNSGTVVSNGQVNVPFNAEDTDNKTGITSDLPNNTLVIARDGVYDLQYRFRCIDVPAVDYICWFYIQVGSDVYVYRRQDQRIDVGQADEYSLSGLFLPAGTRCWVQHYNGNGPTRMGYSNDSGSALFPMRAAATGFSIKEVR